MKKQIVGCILFISVMCFSMASSFATEVDPDNSFVELSHAAIAIEEIVTVTITLRDKDGNVIPDILIFKDDLTIEFSDDSYIKEVSKPYQYISDSKGKIEVTFFGTEVGGKMVKISVNEIILKNQPFIWLRPHVNSTQSNVQRNNPFYEAGSFSTVTITLKDEDGNPIEHVSKDEIIIEVSDTTGVSPFPFIISPDSTEADGVFRTIFTSTKPGTKIITVTADEVEISRKPTAVFIPGDMDLNKSSEMTKIKNGLTINENVDITITFLDKYYNPTKYYKFYKNGDIKSDDIKIKITSKDNEELWNESPSATDSMGVFEEKRYKHNVSNVELDIVITIGEDVLISDTLFIRPEIDPDKSTLKVSSNGAEPDDSTSVEVDSLVTLTIILKDKDGNPVDHVFGDEDIYIVLEDTTGVSTPVSPEYLSKSTVEGKIEATFTSTLAKTNTISIIANNIPITNECSVTFLPGKWESYEIEASADNASVGNYIDVKVTLKDRHGNDVPGVSVKFESEHISVIPYWNIGGDLDYKNTVTTFTDNETKYATASLTCEVPIDNLLYEVSVNIQGTDDYSDPDLHIVSFTKDEQGPIIDIKSKDTTTGKADYKVESIIYDELTTVDANSVYLYFYMLKQEPDSLLMIQDNDNDSLYTAIIPKNDIKVGLRYYVEASDKIGELSTSRTYAVPYAFNDYLSVNGTVESYHSDGVVNNKWTVFSVPVKLEENKDNIDDILAPQLGGSDKKGRNPDDRWFYAGYERNEGNIDNLIYDPDSFTPGEAILLFQRVGIKETKGAPEPGKPVNLWIKGGKVIQLYQEDNEKDEIYDYWNLIGNPFPFEVQLKDIIKVKDPSKIKVYTLKVSDQSSWVESLKKLDEYILPLGGILVYQTPDSGGGGKIAVNLDSKRYATSSEILSKGWGAQIGISSKTTLDEYNYLGIISNADDWLNAPEPPSLGNNESLYFEEENLSGKLMQYCSMYKTVGEEGYVWDICFKSLGKKEKATLTWNRINPQKDITFVLIDISNSNMIEMNEKGKIEFKTFDQNYTYRFKVVAGSEKFCAQYFDGFFAELPQIFELSQNFPNPFNLSTTIRFSLPSAAPITLSIYDILGQKVRSLIHDSILPPGVHSVIWDGHDDAGSTVSSGIFIYQIHAGNFIKSKKMLVIK